MIKIRKVLYQINNSIFLSKSPQPGTRCRRYFSVAVTSLLNMKIGTHDGTFHCDEALACAMLKRLPMYKDAEILRTRDLEKLNLCDIVVDVGGEFDHVKRRYDHHQREFKETLSSLRPELGDKYKIKLSSAGLVYAYYGEELINQFIPEGTTLQPQDKTVIFKKVYEKLFQEIDAVDNGVPMTDSVPAYTIHTHLSSRVGRLNPEWNSKNEVSVDELFQKAMLTVDEEFLFTVNHVLSVWLPARDLVRSAVSKRFDTHRMGQIIELTPWCPWQDHLFDLEVELGLQGEVKFIVYKDKVDSWRVQAVPVIPGSFINRIPLHKSWQGVRDDVLTKLADIEGCIFCHSNGFIGGNRTKDGAIRMAEFSILNVS